MSHQIIPSLTGRGKHVQEFPPVALADDSAEAVTVDRRENSNLISISSIDRSIWRGKIWSTITFKVKTNKYFLEQQQAAADNNNDDEARDDVDASSSSASSYFLRPCVVDCKTGRTYRNGDGGRVKFRFDKNVGKGTDGSVATLSKDVYNSLKAEFHQDLFQNGDSFVLDIEAIREGDSEVIFGRSPIINVTNLALSIEEDFSANPHVIQLDGTDDFAWYSKCGGEKSGLSVIFHLKDEKGRTVNPADAMPLKTELVYDDGTPTPLMPLAPLKERRSSKASKNTLFRRLVPDPSLEPTSDAKSFSFRIEEVSFHHPDKHGFKLKVSPANPHKHFVHPGMLEENIIVLSKPKHDSSKPKKKRGGRTSIVGVAETASDDDDGKITPRPTKIRRASRSSKSKPRKVSNNMDNEHATHISLPLSTFVDSLCPDGKCLSCDKKVAATAFLNEKAHKKTCDFRIDLLPTISVTAIAPVIPAVEVKEECLSSDSEAGAVTAAFDSNPPALANMPPIMPMTQHQGLFIPAPAPSATTSDGPAPFHNGGMGGQTFPMYAAAPPTIAQPGLLEAHHAAATATHASGDDDDIGMASLNPYVSFPGNDASNFHSV